MQELNWFGAGYLAGAFSMLALALFISWWLEREDIIEKGTRDENRILDEAVAIVERRLALTEGAADERAESDPGGAALGIGAAVLPPDAITGSCEGATDVHRSRGRVLRPSSWLVGDDCADYGRSTSLIFPKQKERIH